LGRDGTGSLPFFYDPLECPVPVHRIQCLLPVSGYIFRGIFIERDEELGLLEGIDRDDRIGAHPGVREVVCQSFGRPEPQGNFSAGESLQALGVVCAVGEVGHAILLQHFNPLVPLDYRYRARRTDIIDVPDLKAGSVPGEECHRVRPDRSHPGEIVSSLRGDCE
jgi:hypothetical protein